MSIGFAYGLASGLFFGLMGYLVHACSGRVPAGELAFLRGVVSMAVLAPFSARHLRKALRPNAWTLWLRSLAGAASMILYYWNLQKTTVGTAATLSNLTPVFVTLLAWGVLKELLNVAEAAGIVFAVCGALLLSSGRASAPPPAVIAIGVSGAIAASVAYLALREAALQFSSSMVVWSLSLASSVAAWFLPGAAWIFPTGVLALLVLGVALTGMTGQVLMTNSFVYLRPQVAGVLALTSLVWGVLFEIALDRRRPSAREWLSYSLVVLGVTVLQMATRKIRNARRAVASEAAPTAR